MILTVTNFSSRYSKVSMLRTKAATQDLKTPDEVKADFLASGVMNNTLTPDQVKDKFQKRGITFSGWAKENGYRVNEVYRILNGQSKAKYGKSYEIAVKLGLKSAA